MAPKVEKKAVPKKVGEQPMEDKKRKAEEAPAEEPAAKKAEEEELEKNAAAPKGEQIKATAGFNAADTTLNAIPSLGGKVLMAVNDGGFQYLIAGARANIGIKSGRYMFEVKIIEAINPSEFSSGQRGKVPQPRQLLRVGFSAAGSSLILGDAEDGVFFDADGNFGSGKLRSKVSQKFHREQVVSVLLNLDSSSPNANTVSIFREGLRIAKPQKLPENLVGKTLFPHIAYRNFTVSVNMGPNPAKPLPFTCRMVQTASTADAQIVAESKDGKGEILMPVGFPDEGTFEFVDSFLEKNPSYVELSDRKLQEWAASSGLPKPQQRGGASNDKPSFGYGVPSMDDFSLKRVCNVLAPLTPRKYVIMEVKSNLIESERAVAIKRFSSAKFKKTAMVVMGEPKEDYKKMVHNKILKAKQAKADVDWKMKKATQEKKKEFIAKKKELAEKAKQAEEQRKKMAEEAKAAKAAEGKEEETKEEEKKEEEKKEEEAKPEEKEEEMEDLGEAPPKAELSEEEKKLWFSPKVGNGDIAATLLSKAYGDFSLPEKKEGFDQVKYEWQPEAKSKDYLRKWILETKLTTRIEDLQPSQYFKEKLTAWNAKFQEWQNKQKAFKASGASKTPAGQDVAADIFSVEDVCDIGGGVPLFASFGPEDWTLIQLRYEMHLLQDAFKKDVNDPDRPHIIENHLAFYYGKYYKKQMNPKAFGFTEVPELLKLVKDTVIISEDKQTLESQLSEEVDNLDIFVKMTEESRKERQRRIDAGDETARLKYVTAAPAAPAAAKPPQAATPKAEAKGEKGGKGKGGGKGWKGGKWKW